MVATAMQAFDATIANVALPQLEQSFGGGIELGAWVMTSYLCAAAVIAPLTGWFCRRYGARRVFAGAVGCYLATSLCCALAPSVAPLLLFRVLQGAAGGIIPPFAQATLLDRWPKERHGRMLAIWGAAAMAGPIFGPVIGGIITDLASWRWIFVVNVPLGMIAFFGLRSLPRQHEARRAVPFEAHSILLLITGVAALQLGLERSIGRDWLHSPELIGEAALAFVALAALTAEGLRSRFTLFRLQVFRDRNFAGSALYNFFASAMVFVSMVFVPALSEGPLGYDATLAGAVMSPRGIATMATMVAIRTSIDRIDQRILLAGGLVLTAAAFAMIAEMTIGGSAAWLAAASVIQGIGAGLLLTPLSTLAYTTLGAALRADAAGVYSLLRQLGCAAGVAVMTAVLHARTGTDLLDPAGGNPGSGDGVPAPLPDLAGLKAYADCFRGMGMAALLVLPGVFLFRVRRGDQAAPTTAV